jgi:hypothetical protein
MPTISESSCRWIAEAVEACETGIEVVGTS